jgi:hypothetical protein
VATAETVTPPAMEEGVAFFDYQVLDPRPAAATSPDAGRATARMARGVATIDLVDGATEGTAIALVDLAAAGIDTAADHAVVLDGLELTTDLPQSAGYPAEWSPDRGYASRGMGAAIESVTRMGTTLRVTVAARFEHGRLDLPTLFPGHDQAIAVARTRARVGVLVVAADAPVARASVSYRIAGGRPDPLERGMPCRAPEAETALEIAGSAGLERAIVGLESFDVALWPDQPGVGDALREISIRVRGLAYDGATGRATMLVDGYASNDGPFPRRGMDARIEATVALAQWSGGGPVVAVSFAAPASPGLTPFALPMR